MALELLSLKSRLQLCVDGNSSTSLCLYCVSGVFIEDAITWLLSSELFSCSFVEAGRLSSESLQLQSVVLWWVWELRISGNTSSYVLLCGWWRCDSSFLYCWKSLLRWVFGTACCDSFTYRYDVINNYFCCNTSFMISPHPSDNMTASILLHQMPLHIAPKYKHRSYHRRSLFSWVCSLLKVTRPSIITRINPPPPMALHSTLSTARVLCSSHIPLHLIVYKHHSYYHGSLGIATSFVSLESLHASVIVGWGSRQN